jgi:hypothetical protein
MLRRLSVVSGKPYVRLSLRQESALMAHQDVVVFIPREYPFWLHVGRDEEIVQPDYEFVIDPTREGEVKGVRVMCQKVEGIVTLLGDYQIDPHAPMRNPFVLAEAKQKFLNPVFCITWSDPKVVPEIRSVCPMPRRNTLVLPKRGGLTEEEEAYNLL